MSFAQLLQTLPGDALVPVSWVREQLRENGVPEEVTTAEAAEHFGRSAKWWQRQASEIPGAYKDGAGWHLPAASCRAHLARLQRQVKGGLRGPWKPSASASSR